MMTLLDQLVEKFPYNPDVYSRYLGEPSLQELVLRMMESYYMDPEVFIGLDIPHQIGTMIYALENNPALYKDCQTEFYLTRDEHILKASIAGADLENIPAMELKENVVNSIINLDLVSWLELQTYALSTIYGRAVT